MLQDASSDSYKLHELIAKLRKSKKYVLKNLKSAWLTYETCVRSLWPSFLPLSVQLLWQTTPVSGVLSCWWCCLRPPTDRVQRPPSSATRQAPVQEPTVACLWRPTSDTWSRSDVALEWRRRAMELRDQWKPTREGTHPRPQLPVDKWNNTFSLVFAWIRSSVLLAWGSKPIYIVVTSHGWCDECLRIAYSTINIQTCTSAWGKNESQPAYLISGNC